MIGSSRAVDLEVLGEVPQLLRSASFKRSEGLWVKGVPAVVVPGDQLSKRYEYTKMGKLLGIATTRFLAVGAGSLYYFDVVLVTFRPANKATVSVTVLWKIPICSGWS